MAAVMRIKPGEDRRRVQARGALLVCAYDNEELYGRMRLEGAMTLGELNARLPGIRKEQESSSSANDRRSPRLPVGQRSLRRKGIRTSRPWRVE